jgi:hypothetical protein
MAEKKTKASSEADVLSKITPEMLEAFQVLMKQQGEKKNSSLSLYNDVRDIKKIETARLKRFDNKFVIGFKDMNNDPYETRPQYTFNKPIMDRKLPNEPHLVLLLSNDGKEVEEKEVALVDYMNYRKDVQVPVLEVIKKEIIEDKGLLGQRGGSSAFEVDGEGKPVSRVAVRKEVRREEVFLVLDVPGFDDTLTINSNFVA